MLKYFLTHGDKVIEYRFSQFLLTYFFYVVTLILQFFAKTPTERVKFTRYNNFELNINKKFPNFGFFKRH